jgi:hypothetical protein
MLIGKLTIAIFLTDDLGMPRDEEQATGLERKELDALIAGVDVC